MESEKYPIYLLTPADDIVCLKGDKGDYALYQYMDHTIIKVSRDEIDKEKGRGYRTHNIIKLSNLTRKASIQ